MKIILGVLLTVALVSFFTPVFADTVTVKMVSGSSVPGCEETNECYSPDPVVISPGDSVRWINVDNAAHTATSGTPADGPDGVFDSGMIMASGDSYEKFPTKGIYPYFCMLHPWMQSQVWVVETETEEPEYEPPTSSPSPSTPSSDTSSSLNWQQRYLEVLSDFNDVSSKVGQLEKKNQQLESEMTQLKNENNQLRSQIDDLNQTIKDLNAVVMEQVKVIYEWVLGK